MPIYRSRRNPAVTRGRESVFTKARARRILSAQFRMRLSKADALLDAARRNGSASGPYGEVLVHYDGYNAYRIVEAGDAFYSPEGRGDYRSWDPGARTNPRRKAHWSGLSDEERVGLAAKAGSAARRYEALSQKRKRKRKAKTQPRDSNGRFVSKSKPTRRRRRKTVVQAGAKFRSNPASKIKALAPRPTKKPKAKWRKITTQVKLNPRDRNGRFVSPSKRRKSTKRKKARRNTKWW